MNFWQSLRVIILLNLLGLFTINIKSVQANPQQCYQQALPTFANSDTADLVAWMCQGATSTISAQCFKAALPTFYDDQVAKRAAMVCKGATSTAPGKCFIETIGTFYNSESVERAFKLCKANSNTSDPSSISNNSPDKIYGAWYVEMNKWSGLLRMNGDYATLVLVDNQNHVAEQRMQLKRDSQDKYILDGDVIVTNLRGYWANNFYIQQFLKGTMTVKNCDDKKAGCTDVTLTYLGE
ncbi:hypothetical protein [Nostoc sp.]|uniref:hypothetical protein n=1 Tax=Nostoc sp. TaxID=1180 RepID=UPI002FFB73C6